MPIKSTGYMDLSSMDTGICFTRWATDTDIDRWEVYSKMASQRYSRIIRTRTDNYGERLSDCRAMEDFYRGRVD